MNSNNVVFQCFNSIGKKRLKKGCCKVLFNGKDSLLLHPQQRIRSLIHWQAILIKGDKISLKKISNKACENKVKVLVLQPAKQAKFIEVLTRIKEFEV